MAGNEGLVTIAIMQQLAPLPKIRRRNIQSPKPTFSVVAIHEGGIAGMRAQDTLQSLKEDLCSDLEIHSACWSFQNLERLDLRAMSIRIGAASDVIVVSASDKEVLPDHIKRWLDACLQKQRDGRAMLVALHEDERGCDHLPGPLCSHLEQQAFRWETEFTCNDDLKQHLNPEAVLRRIQHQEHAQRLRDQAIRLALRPSALRWGINE